MVEEIRNKWCEDLEDILQCPVCMERPKCFIYQCMQGHPICQICKPQLQRCPTCTEGWSNSRNRLAEDLCTKLDEIKLSLIDPENEINILLIPEKVSTASQTDGTRDDTVLKNTEKKTFNADHGSKVYPCWIGICKGQRNFESTLKHLVIDHAPNFSELVNDGNVFQHSWIFEFSEQMTFDKAFLIPDMGVFFLKLSSDIFGNFTGFILMVHNGFIAKHFTYQLEIHCCPEHACPIFTSEVCSCRIPPSQISEKCLKVKRQDMQKLLNHQKRLNCTLLISKRPLTEEAAGPKPLQNGKKHNYNKKRFPPPKKQTQNGPNVPNAGPPSYTPVFHVGQQQPRLQRLNLRATSMENIGLHL